MKTTKQSLYTFICGIYTILFLIIGCDLPPNAQLENPALTCLHTIFLREHNRKASELLSLDESLSDEILYQEARRYIIAHIQQITYFEYLPMLLGRNR